MIAEELRNSHRGKTVRVIGDGRECVIDSVTHSRFPHTVTVNSVENPHIPCLVLPWETPVEVFA